MRATVSNKFEEAVAESLRAVESYHHATATIAQMVEALDAAVSAQTTGRVRVKTENRPTGLRIHIFVYVDNEPDRQREVCALQPSQSGYPIEVLSLGIPGPGVPMPRASSTSSRFGLKLNALMIEAQMAELADV